MHRRCSAAFRFRESYTLADVYSGFLLSEIAVSYFAAARARGIEIVRREVYRRSSRERERELLFYIPRSSAVIE